MPPFRRGYNAAAKPDYKTENPYEPETEEFALWADGYATRRRDCPEPQNVPISTKVRPSVAKYIKDLVVGDKTRSGVTSDLIEAGINARESAS